MVSGSTYDATAATLAAVADNVRVRRTAAVEELRLVLAWADLHGEEPVSAREGGDRLISLGGEGTPPVSEFCFAELALARGAGVVATKNLAADALDLRHRMPELYARVCSLQVEVWVARKVATMTRPLTPEAAAVVDEALAKADRLHPGQLLDLAQARVIEADLEAHRRRIAADANATGVWMSRPRPGDLLGGEAGAAEPATRRISAKLPLADAVELDAMVDELADALGRESDEDGATRDQLRSEALALLARPAQALALLAGEDQSATRNPRRAATIYLHLAPGSHLARVEGIGPLLLEQVADLLGHRNVTVRPVIDLNAVHAVTGYEHPAAMRSRTMLRTGGDVFPHSTRSTGRIDHDHVTAYQPQGPPGQTSDLNDAPLTRLHHRVKTHDPGWKLRQLGLGAYRWTSPHGITKVVTPRGTRDVQPVGERDGTVTGELYFT